MIISDSDMTYTNGGLFNGEDGRGRFAFQASTFRLLRPRLRLTVVSRPGIAGQAMKTLKLFSDKERDYHAYQARQNYLREQRTIQIEREEDHREMERIKQEKEQIQHDMEQAQQDLQRERMEKQAALQREQAAQAEIERLKALLAQSKQ